MSSHKYTYPGEELLDLQRRRDFSNVIAFGVPGEGKPCADRRIDEEDTGNLGP
jgi:hypothetical protein